MLNVFDTEEMHHQILKATKELERARLNFEGYVEQWRKLASSSFQGALNIEDSVSGATLINGSIASKDFAVHAYPLVKGGKSFLGARVSVEFRGSERLVDVLTFLISSTGDIHDCNGTKAVDVFGNKPSLTLLVNVLNEVLAAPLPQKFETTHSLGASEQ